MLPLRALVDHPKVLAYQGHVFARLFADGGQGAAEKIPVGLAPIVQRAIAFPFLPGEAGVDLLEGQKRDFGGLYDAQRLIPPIQHNPNIARQVARGRFTQTGILPPEFMGRTPGLFEAFMDEYAKRNIALKETVTSL